jgi:hypothetical protein
VEGPEPTATYLRDEEQVPATDDLDQIRANLALTPAQRLEQLLQMDEFFLMARRARWMGSLVGGSPRPRRKD